METSPFGPPPRNSQPGRICSSLEHLFQLSRDAALGFHPWARTSAGSPSPDSSLPSRPPSKCRLRQQDRSAYGAWTGTIRRTAGPKSLKRSICDWPIRRLSGVEPNKKPPPVSRRGLFVVAVYRLETTIQAIAGWRRSVVTDEHVSVVKFAVLDLGYIERVSGLE